MNDLEMAAKFREAADYIKKHGWQQWGVGLDGGPRCVWGAVKSVTGEPITMTFDGPSRVPMEQISRWLGHENPHIGSVICWNWQKGRTAEDVIALFEAVANDLELRHQVAAIAEKGDEPEPQPQEPEKEPVAAHA